MTSWSAFKDKVVGQSHQIKIWLYCILSTGSQMKVLNKGRFTFLGGLTSASSYSRVCEIRRTRRLCPANFGSVQLRGVVRFNQMSGKKLEMSGKAQNNFAYSSCFIISRHPLTQTKINPLNPTDIPSKNIAVLQHSIINIRPPLKLTYLIQRAYKNLMIQCCISFD